MSKATFPFDLRIATSAADLEAACRVRSLAYGRHTPSLQAQLSVPESVDTLPGVVVLLCREKASGRAIGSARVQTNSHGPLLIERSVSIPRDIAEDTRAEITRLSVIPGGDPHVKLALFKAVYLCCLAMQVRWMIIGARSDSLKSQYERLGFLPLSPSDKNPQMVPLMHTGNVLHYVLRFDVTSAERYWHEQRNSLYRFMFRTSHPDLHLLPTKLPVELVLSVQQPTSGNENVIGQTEAVR